VPTSIISQVYVEEDIAVYSRLGGQWHGSSTSGARHRLRLRVERYRDIRRGAIDTRLSGAEKWVFLDRNVLKRHTD
jgi:hypothetical protein